MSSRTKPVMRTTLNIMRAVRAFAFAFATLLCAGAAAAEGGGLKLLSVTTLLGEFITFGILIWVMMKFVWPPLTAAIENRRKEIADGLAAAEQGKKDLAAAAAEKDAIVKEARAAAGKIIAEGESQKAAIVASAREEAENEKKRIVQQGVREVETERAAMQRDMQKRIGGLVVSGAARILGREVDPKAHADIVDSLREKI